MTALAEMRTPSYADLHGSERLFEPGEITLEDAILDLSGELAASGRAECPLCGGELRAAGGCEDCGAELSYQVAG